MRLRLPPTILFGNGTARELPRVVAELGAAQPLLVTDRGVAAAGIPERLRGELAAAGIDAEIWDGVETDPGEGHAERCAERLRAGGHDMAVAVGGGSVLDVAKVAAFLAVAGGRTADYFGLERVPRAGLPWIAVPTTAGSGAEVSSHAVIAGRASGRKEVLSGVHLVARAALVDPELTATLPPRLTAYSALDALIHAIEGYLARAATPFTDAFAEMAVPRLAAALPRVLSDPADAAAREELAEGCLYASCAMANASAGAIHALGYPLTSRYGVPHGLANALMAAAALERIAPAAPERTAVLARHLGGAAAADLPERVLAFLASVGIADTLAGWKVAEADLPSLAEAAVLFGPILRNTPVAVALDSGDLLAIYRAAYAGGRL